MDQDPAELKLVDMTLDAFEEKRKIEEARQKG